MKKHLVSASIYPVILIVVGGLVSLFLLGYVVPRFSHIYEDIGGDLPWLTRVLMAWGKFVEARGGMLLAGVVAALTGLVLWLRQPSARQLIARQIMRIPAIGERVRVYQLTRFYRTMGMLLTGGTPVPQALVMVSGLLDQELRQRLDAALKRIREGQPISTSLDGQGLTTPVALRMLRVGERTGQMGEMMERIAAFHEEELARWVERFTRTFEPLLMAVIGVVIGGIVRADVLPDLRAGREHAMNPRELESRRRTSCPTRSRGRAAWRRRAASPPSRCSRKPSGLPPEALRCRAGGHAGLRSRCRWPRWIG